MLVSNESLAHVARRLDLDAVMLRDDCALGVYDRDKGVGGAVGGLAGRTCPYSLVGSSRLRCASKWRADAVEALVAAIHLDTGVLHRRRRILHRIVGQQKHRPQPSCPLAFPPTVVCAV